MLLGVRLFGGLTERAGASRVDVELPDGATVADLRRAVADQHPRLADSLPSVKVAVDLEVANDDDGITPGSEVALLPPVAGGATDTTDGARRSATGAGAVEVRDVGGVKVVTGLHEPPFDLDAVTAAVSAPEVGGSVHFLGTVRDHSGSLDDVVRLDYSAYPEMAEKVLADLAEELIDDFPALRGIALLHAVGELPVGAHTILIVCAASHRAEAFDACREALERVKDRVPVWKREVTADGEHRWVGLHGSGPDDATSPT